MMANLKKLSELSFMGLLFSISALESLCMGCLNILQMYFFPNSWDLILFLKKGHYSSQPKKSNNWWYCRKNSSQSRKSRSKILQSTFRAMELRAIRSYLLHCCCLSFQVQKSNLLTALTDDKEEFCITFTKQKLLQHLKENKIQKVLYPAI